jgi:heme oxygenase
MLFLARLKEATKAQHAAVERSVNLPRLCGSREAYADHLARLYGFYRPVEDVLWGGGVLSSAGLGGDDRRKTPRLAADLFALGVEASGLPGAGAEALPVGPTSPPAELFGCLYVLEGATLGGRVITRVVRERLGVGPGCGGAFFHGYGEATDAMWGAFRAVLARFASTGERQDAVVRAARATFDAMDAWLAVGQEVKEP